MASADNTPQVKTPITLENSNTRIAPEQGRSPHCQHNRRFGTPIIAGLQFLIARQMPVAATTIRAMHMIGWQRLQAVDAQHRPSRMAFTAINKRFNARQLSKTPSRITRIKLPFSSQKLL
ncbi:Uncharacterised protein [Serratia fonticola]|uniref:Uncharacterized protein n=1 Tax=Serratia fonticola TaxID=47917 RepID=A0A4V6KRC5_SERFO|nr:Uncharacterised protein [Serratia fonticola]